MIDSDDFCAEVDGCMIDSDDPCAEGDGCMIDSDDPCAEGDGCMIDSDDPCAEGDGCKINFDDHCSGKEMGQINDLCHCDSDNIDPVLEELLTSLKVMTLATVWNHGVWSAPVYYLYKNRFLYFFSSPSSRHIIGATSPPSIAAASIYQDNASVKEIKGIQMRGQVEAVTGKKEAREGAAGYAEKFALRSRNWSLQGLSPSELLSFLKQYYRASFYKFVPIEMIYMDNSVYIGFKKEISL